MSGTVTDSPIGSLNAHFCMAEPRISQAHKVSLTEFRQAPPHKLEVTRTLSQQQEN